jgi:selenide, water dikinase
VNKAYPIARHLVLLGGGHSHIIVLRMLGMNPVPGLQVTLISPDRRTPYSGMLPGYIAGHYQEEDIHIELDPLCRFAGAGLIQGSVTGLDPDQNKVFIEGRPAIEFDVLSIDIGITPDFTGLQTTSPDLIPVKPIGSFIAQWKKFLAGLETVKNIAVVGGGAGGVELCLSISHRLGSSDLGGLNPAGIEIHQCAASPGLLPDYAAGVKKRVSRELHEAGIVLHDDFTAIDYERGLLRSQEGEQIEVEKVFWVTNAAAQSWLTDTGVALDEHGYVAVSASLQSLSHPHIFAAGDTAAVIDHPRPKAGVYAVRQGEPLFNNLVHYIHGRRTRAFRPQGSFLSLISTGGRSAVAAKWWFAAQGRICWIWKDWIDRRFVDRFRLLPAMPVAELKSGLLAEFDDQMQCGGCGSKVTSEILNEVLDELAPGSERDDAAFFAPPDGYLMLHSIDAFRSFLDDPYVLARIAVVHAASDIYAMGGSVATLMANMILPFAKPRPTRNLLRQLLSGALDQIAEEGATLIGGHSSEGAELSVGFAVNGLVAEGSEVRKSGLVADDVLILSQPLGIGTLFAAHMQGKAEGRHIEAAINAMQQSSRRAAEIFLAHDVHGMTDVTGFGLAGHLGEMLVASKKAAEICLTSIPALPGAIQIISTEGITSTLHDSNRQNALMLLNPLRSEDLNSAARYELLFDPQTAGGLLAGISMDKADGCLAALKLAGYDASIIGKVTSGPAMISLQAD